jgi:4-hydroxythreonine-4-phosphate dehydrogenase
MSELLAIALGDVTGIGPEVTIKALSAEADADDTRYVILGDPAQLETQKRHLGLTLELQPYSGPLSSGRHFIHRSALSDPLPEGLPCGAPSAARAALTWLTEGCKLCLRGEASALVTAPLSKEAIVRAGHPFVGQTELLAELAGAPEPIMMLLGQDDRERWLRVALTTTHLALRLVPEAITPHKVGRAIERAAQACRDLGLPRARIAVCGLNPHAGEGGQFGDEDQRIIAPAVRALRQSGLDVAGPLSADTVFYQTLGGHYDAVVAQYHDQGLGPLKTVAFEHGVNWTLGLPFIRTSPDHGTGYDIAGQGVANPASMIAAIRLAKQLARRKTQSPAR